MHDCKQEEFIGRVKEFMASTKGLKATIFTISMAILLQVGTFLFMWGSLTTTVNKNTEHLWKVLTPATEANTRTLDKVLTKLDSIKIVGYAIANDKEQEK